MISYRCVMCRGYLVEDVVEGWHYCAQCDINYSKIILTPELGMVVTPDDTPSLLPSMQPVFQYPNK